MNTNNDNPQIDKPLIKSTIRFPVVGIGASAGGLEAFKKLIKAIPEKSGMAYILVQHLAPTHESVLPELLQRVTTIPIHEITDSIRVEPDNIYIIPANRLLVASDGVLHLSPRPPKDQKRMPIDIFFTSLAEVHGSHAIGVVLSGTGTDGTLGLKAIKDSGGLTFAEDEASAAFDSMPNSAVEAGVVDFILPPEAIPKKIADIKKQVILTDDELQKLPPQEDDAYKQILFLLRIRRRTDFTYYKQTTIRRRILRRIAINKMEDAVAYLQYLRENKSEQDILYLDLLIPVTSFFRDKKIFETLCESVFPTIEKAKPAYETIRIWVAGCSTGQEAYSIAICLKEFFADPSREGVSPALKVQIFATDISEPAIAKARSGIYTKAEVEGLSPLRLQEFFTRTDGSYQLNKSIRDICVFAVHNFLKDPPFAKVDFVSCRNALIYMEPYLQKKALTAFHYALNPKSYLLLGKSETTTSAPDLFSAVGKSDKLFIRKDAPGRFMYTTPQRGEQILRNGDNVRKNENQLIDFQKTANDILLNKYTPAGVIVNEMMDIVHFRGGTGTYLEPSPGKASLNLLVMAKNGLAFELRNILHQAKKNNAPAIKENIPVIINNSQRNITIEAIPLPNSVEPYYLILFHDKTNTSDGVSPETSNKEGLEKSDKDLRIQQLEQDLLQLREDMQTITEEQESANEELQSANEEMLSSSEELQSLNEELETSKEELQSTNEELTIVNQEMTSLNDQIREARNYAESIVSTIREPLLILDKNLRVKTANRAFYKTFMVNEKETEGVLVYQLGDKQWNIPELRILLEKILPEKTGFAELEVTHNFLNIGERVMLLNAREMKRENGSENLILLAIEDITEKTIARRRIDERNDRYHNALMQSPFAFSIMKGKDMEITLANKQMKEFWGKGDEVEGKTLLQVLPELKDQPFPGMIDSVYTSGNPVYANEILARLNHNGNIEDRYFNIVYQALLEADETISGVITIAHEVTNQVVARKKMETQAVMVQNLLMTAPGFCATLNGPDHVYDLVNEQYQGLFGQRKILGKPLMVALPELEGQGIDKLLDKVYNTGKPYVGIDIPITLASDENLAPEERYFNFSYQPMYDEQKIIYSILVFGYEVTDQVIAKNKNLQNEQSRANELEEKVQQRTLELGKANDDLKKINLELESFTYVSSHDLQEPLRKIRTFLNLILQKEYAVLSETGKDYFQRVNNAAIRMQTLIKDLLNYSHAQITVRQSIKTNLDIIIGEVKAEFSDALLEKAAILEAGNIGEADISPFQFRQVIINLVTNALKFSRPGVPPRIIIKSDVIEAGKLQEENPAIFGGMLPAEKFYLHIWISDNGIGFNPEYKDKIFQVFQRLHGKDEYEGTGIGLAIVKKIIDNYNGYITATGELGIGARFDIYLPRL